MFKLLTSLRNVWTRRSFCTIAVVYFTDDFWIHTLHIYKGASRPRLAVCVCVFPERLCVCVFPERVSPRSPRVCVCVRTVCVCARSPRVCVYALCVCVHVCPYAPTCVCVCAGSLTEVRSSRPVRGTKRTVVVFCSCTSTLLT